MHLKRNCALLPPVRSALDRLTQVNFDTEVHAPFSRLYLGSELWLRLLWILR
jgi:hypothetical protein